jgi:hypothetical protein
MCEESNGYKNRETFDVITYLDNEERLQSMMKELATRVLAETTFADERGDLGLAYYELGDLAQSYFEELNDFDNLTRETFVMLMDIGSLFRVSWREIGEKYINQIIEDYKFA